MLFGAAGCALVTVFFLAVDLGGTVAGAPDPYFGLAALIWSGPFLIYAASVRTRTIAVVGGLTLLTATAAFLIALFRDQGSTAGIGVMTIPLLLYPGSLLVLAVDTLVAARGTGEAAWRGLLRRLLAVAVAFLVAIAAVFTLTGFLDLFDPEHRAGEYFVESLVMTATSAVTAVAGFLLIKRLWRQQCHRTNSP